MHESSKQNDDVDYMSNCPIGWFLSVSNQTAVGNPPSQRCQNDNDVNDWICAPGWVKLQHDPFCQREEQLAELRRNFAPVGPDFSQVSEKFKLLFIHIPQTGGLLIERSFLFDDKRELLNGHYLGGHYSINDFDSELVKSYHKFCVVRHPCSRLFSVWKYLSQRQGNENDDQWVDEHFDETTSFSFNAFIKKTLQPEGDVDVETETHLKSQINLLFDDQSHFGLDQVLVFERWNESMNALGERLKVDTSILKDDTYIREEDVNCKDVYNEETWEKMTRLYEMDICVLGYSNDINHANDVPSITTAVESLTGRYQSCKKQLSSHHSKEEVGDAPFVEFVDSDQNVAMPMKVQNMKGKIVENAEAEMEDFNASCVVYTYFQQLADKAEAYDTENNEILMVWKKAWAEAGWFPQILTEEDAKAHPEYQQLREKFMSLPTVNSKDYEVSCFMRYVAMAAAGGGWMTDYDVLPIRLPGCTAPFNDGKLTIHERFVPALVSGSQAEYIRIAREMSDIDWRADSDIFNYNGDIPHVSDMLCLVKFVDDKRVESEWTVNSANEVFGSPFNCDQSQAEPKYRERLAALGLPRLPIAVHYSHSSLSSLRVNDSPLAETWDVIVTRSQFMTSRASVMKAGNDFFRRHCK